MFSVSDGIDAAGSVLVAGVEAAGDAFKRCVFQLMSSLKREREFAALVAYNAHLYTVFHTLLAHRTKRAFNPLQRVSLRKQQATAPAPTAFTDQASAVDSSNKKQENNSKRLPSAKQLSILLVSASLVVGTGAVVFLLKQGVVPPPPAAPSTLSSRASQQSEGVAAASPAAAVLTEGKVSEQLHSPAGSVDDE